METAPVVENKDKSGEIDCGDQLKQILQQFPPLPSNVRYFDSFDERIRTISRLNEVNEFTVADLGSTLRIDLTKFSSEKSLFLKHVLHYAITSTLQPATAARYLYAIREISDELFIDVLMSRPTGINEIWLRLMASDVSHQVFDLFKVSLRMLAAYGVNEWSDAYIDLLRSLPYPPVDKYVSVRSGEAFISTGDEKSIIEHLDLISRKCEGSAADVKVLEDAGILACAYQFGMRPVQLAMLKLMDVKVIAETRGHTVHLKFHMAKQRTDRSRVPLVRKVKFEWAPIFVALAEHHRKSLSSPSARFFNKKSSKLVQQRLGLLTERLTGGAIGGTQLRHSAAQRLVDAGASQEELASFLGHSFNTTGLVYFESSPNQAQLINKALGASEIYSRVAKALHDRFIDPDQLRQLKDDQQIAGVPHGMPIAGIGGCELGQPSCPFNPIMSCYGCRKFMPLNDIAVHQSVLSGMREVVSVFAEASRGESASPAYLQLRQTIDEVKMVVSELEGSDQ